jgi:carbon-monoxide dehydrogenase medium subunit
VHLPDTVLHEPPDLAAAGAILQRLGSRARIMAGGTDLLADLKAGRIDPGEILSLARIPDLRGIWTVASQSGQITGRNGQTAQGGGAGLRIGALTTIAELAASPLLSGPYAVVAEAAQTMAAPQIRNAATIGGNIAGAVPCADLPPALCVLKASLTLWSPSGTRTMPLESFFLEPRRTVRREDELLTEILIPPPPADFGAAYERLSLRDGNAIAVASVAASLSLNPSGTIAAARLVLGAVAPVPMRVIEAERRLVRQRLDRALDDAIDAAMAAARPISDVRGSAEYRRHLVGVLTRRALRVAWRRAMEATT